MALRRGLELLDNRLEGVVDRTKELGFVGRAHGVVATRGGWSRRWCHLYRDNGSTVEFTLEVNKLHNMISSEAVNGKIRDPAIIREGVTNSLVLPLGDGE